MMNHTTENVTWGTKEDLWLTYAIDRHGWCNWDAIARQLTQCSTGKNLICFNAKSCKERYLTIQEQFNGDGNQSIGISNADEQRERSLLNLMMHELNQRRRDELRLEIEACSTRIEALKVKMRNIEDEVPKEGEIKEKSKDATPKLVSSEESNHGEGLMFDEINSTKQTDGYHRSREGKVVDEQTVMQVKKEKHQCEELLKVLEMLREREDCCLFDTRLPSQEKGKYARIIREHMDLKTIESKVDQAAYLKCTKQFYRDLLLICNNAIVFFPKNSMEYEAAHKMRILVTSEMEKRMDVPVTPEESFKVERRVWVCALEAENNAGKQEMKEKRKVFVKKETLKSVKKERSSKQ